jgi:hypothetical protein
MKLDDEIVELEEWDVVRVPPGTWRGYEGGPEGLEILVFGAPDLGENPRDDVEGQRDWWTTSARWANVGGSDRCGRGRRPVATGLRLGLS